MAPDAPSIVERLKAALPSRWFADESPVLDGILAGLAWGWTWLFALLDDVSAQTRISTATDVWLDIIAQDFFGPRVQRRSGQQDGPFRDRILRELLRERGTRHAVEVTLLDLTGCMPQIFEPARATDTGAYGSLAGEGGALGYGVAGGWGNLNLPFQCFITAFRPASNGIALVSGWGGGASTIGVGAYGIGAIEYGSLDMVQGRISDPDIFEAIKDVMPVASIGWARISN